MTIPNIGSLDPGTFCSYSCRIFEQYHLIFLFLVVIITIFTIFTIIVSLSSSSSSSSSCYILLLLNTLFLWVQHVFRQHTAFGQAWESQSPADESGHSWALAGLKKTRLGLWENFTWFYLKNHRLAKYFWNEVLSQLNFWNDIVKGIEMLPLFCMGDESMLWHPRSPKIHLPGRAATLAIMTKAAFVLRGWTFDKEDEKDNMIGAGASKSKGEQKGRAQV